MVVDCRVTRTPKRWVLLLRTTKAMVVLLLPWLASLFKFFLRYGADDVFHVYFYLTLIDPKTLWAMHYPGQPMDVVFSYACKAKGSAISGLLAGLLLSYTKPLHERHLHFLSCLIFQGLALMHHSWCCFFEPKDYRSTLLNQPCMVSVCNHASDRSVGHPIGVLVFGYLVEKALAAAEKTKSK